MAGILKVDQVQSDSNLAFAIAGSNVAFMNATSLQMVGSNVSLAGTNVITNGKVVASGMPVGAVLQVVQAFKSDTFSTTSTSFTDITGLSVSITPTSATSKILVKLVLSISGTNTSGSTYRITRGGSAIGIADAASNRNRGSGAELYNTRNDTNYNYGAEYLDSPSSTSSLTYAAQAIVGSGTGTVYVNRSSSDTDSGSYVRGVSSITVMEIAA